VPGADVVVGRQAIFNTDLAVIGYELLFRSVEAAEIPAAELHAGRFSGDLMTSEVIFSSVSIGIDRLVGDKLVFCNADRGLLLGEIEATLPPHQTVIEVLESVCIDDEILAGCRALVEQGYRLALDDFMWFDGAEELIELAWMVKIDLRVVTGDNLTRLVKRCQSHGVALLAEKIETAEELARCRELGFEYFQGYLLARPRIVPGRTLDGSHIGRMRLAAQLLSDEVDFDRLEEIIRTEPGLTFQILRLASIGTHYGTRRDIRSMRQALVMVGARRIQSWVALLMLARPAATSTEDIAVVLTRARMCELLAGRLNPATASMAYTAGMLSAFDVLLGLPMADILEQLPLDEQLRLAAFEQVGPLGEIVADVVGFQNRPEQAGRLVDRYGLSLHLASIRALTWAVDATRGWDSLSDLRTSEEPESA
jgi:c-di-GMP-related signal transduction protein